jgi:hypothetical protein
VTQSPNQLKNLRPQPWQPGQSGNPAGRPPRAQLSERFIGDMCKSWAEEGPKVLSTLARTQPAVYAGLAAKLVPTDVQISLEARLPAGLDPSDWQLVMAMLEAVKIGVPNANSLPPQQVLEHTLNALRAYGAKTIDGE